MSRSFILAAALLTTASADARPLSLAELFDMGMWLECAEQCPEAPSADAAYDIHIAFHECRAACGHAPRLWEKNGVGSVDRADHELALLEYQDAQDPTKALICYADADATVVVPSALCAGLVCEEVPECTEDDCAADPDATLTCTDDEPGGARCWWPDQKRPATCPDVVCDANPIRSVEECSDDDDDGLPKWLEDHVDGLDPTSTDALCGRNTTCGFEQTCAWNATIGAGQCVARICDGPCTAFHLEIVGEDDQHVLVHVFHDFTPVPARVIDLYLEYDPAQLTLEDARPLQPLVLADKQLGVTHLSDMTLRLSVFGPTSGSHPVPHGPIVELVFQRHTHGAPQIAFSTNDELQAKTVAPLQGEVHEQLKNDELWGAPVSGSTLADVTTRLQLHYSFDTLDTPLTYSAVPDADLLCADVADCVNEPDDVIKALYKSRLEALQKGELHGGEAIAGLSGNGCYLDGAADQLRMPVHYREPLAPGAQSTSMGAWFYTEGNSIGELKKTPQILFAHTGFDERTRFGLALHPEGGGTVKLVLFDGDMLSKAPPPTEIVIAEGIQLRTWHHAGFALDAATGKIGLYFDGRRVAEHTFGQPVAIGCPQFFGATDVQLHEEGDVLGGRPPEHLYAALRHSGLDRVHRMHPSGLGDTVVLGDGQHNFRDPDYSPLLDRIVYASDMTGSYEIWMAEGDGANPVQLTIGFGDADRAISARRPRWAPGGTGIVFDSNVFDILADDNAYGRVRHLYFIGYDPVNNEVAIETLGDTITELDYEALLADQTIGDYRITGQSLDLNHKGARWLAGKSNDGKSRGVVLAETWTGAGSGRKVHRVEIGDVIPTSDSTELYGLGGPLDEVRLLAAHRSVLPAVPTPIVVEKALIERSSSLFDPEEQFAVSVAADADGATVTITHVPSGYDEWCWDDNLNQIGDPAEDMNGDQQFTTADCAPRHVRNLYVEFDSARYLPNLTPVEHPLESMGKVLELDEAYPQGRAFVRVELRSPLSASPIPAGPIATIRFENKHAEPAEVAFGTWKRIGLEDVLVKDLTTAQPPELLDPAGMFDTVDDGVFSPAGDRLMLSTVFLGRPNLLATEDLISAQGATKVLLQPKRARGLDWVQLDRFMPCNTVGGCSTACGAAWTTSSCTPVCAIRICSDPRPSAGTSCSKPSAWTGRSTASCPVAGTTTSSARPTTCAWSPSA